MNYLGTIKNHNSIYIMIHHQSPYINLSVWKRGVGQDEPFMISVGLKIIDSEHHLQNYSSNQGKVTDGVHIQMIVLYGSEP